MRVLQYRPLAIAGTVLVLAGSTGDLSGIIRSESQPPAQVAQYCAPRQQSDAPDAPSIYCLERTDLTVESAQPAILS